MSKNWTKGPWVSDPHNTECVGDVTSVPADICVAQAQQVASIREMRRAGRDIEREANTNLICAAPDLYDALEEVMLWIRNWDPEFANDPEWDDDTKPRVMQALAKARGEQ